MRTAIQESILKLLHERRSTYAHPLNSQAISEVLNITPSYVREQMSLLQRENQVAVRRGPKGGYYQVAKEKTLRLQWNDAVTEHEAGTFLHVYQQLLQQANEAEQIITGLMINGVEVLPDSVAGMAHTEIAEAVVQTKPMPEFAGDLIATALDYLPNLQQGLVRIANLMQEGREQEAHELFLQAVDGLEWLDSCLGGLGGWMAQKGDTTLQQLHGMYQGQLSDLSELMEQKSITEISDLLEYELSETVANAKASLSELQSFLDTVGKES
ncbi:Rrf2 family transcriptional regulator [Tumebacillus algifaecis]|uniref:Rrf2 family transcriptional regulator n=1 Tax=Tumebacillus algifaecis TaxID=1214604 RepID=UPI001D13249A|nr:Rrf2 family transcriptional regulator [Tumebacillus algifaecis]